ncbi:MAG: GGDEF domain-containing response regulator [Gammaproteobacteria bacterium]|nr:GGDEF domain-containing response regulator [Gammaproteobacteria bacterium]NND40207.1 GGDEF domain-containing response regulator [Pseudomonadales bacterium]MBT8151531.1 GGDEF domain-containing response regulator [Gammaproteobacteria bacterium]NNL10429.1 GGDEF domain-containing response regulator [Pseudomonadales bacterium]NNM12224.1 GGDEF domain-containing response regulator [Pseudomonadales bacterium]
MEKQINILLVEDFDADRINIARLLERIPLTVNLQSAVDVKSAMLLLEHQAFDCVLLDYHLPSGTGDELLEYIRYHDLPTAIIMLTGNVNDSIVDECLLGGAQDFLDKGELNEKSLSHAIAFAIKRFSIEKAIRFSALHDPLTKLANRTLFEEHLEQAFLRAQRSGRLIGLVMLDVDDFKRVNDTYGHPAGDAALLGVAQRLKNASRRNDTAARIGGDEFVLLLEGLRDAADAQRIVQKILSAAQQPVNCDGNEIFIEHSIGIALSEGNSDDVDQLVRQADQALYEAKRAGKGCFRIFSGTTTKKQRKNLNTASSIS